MSILTPTTEEMRDQHALDEFGQRDWSTDLSYAEFDRWLAAHDAEIRTAALEDAANSYPGSPSHPTVKWLRNRAAQP